MSNKKKGKLNPNDILPNATIVALLQDEGLKAKDPDTQIIVSEAALRITSLAAQVKHLSKLLKDEK